MASISVLGQTPLAVRLPAIVGGIAFAGALYCLGRQLGGTLLGTIAGVLGAALFWHADSTRAAWGYAGWGLTCETLGVAPLLYAVRHHTVARAIGMTSHTDGPTMAKAIEHNDLDCVQMAMNPARALRFEEMALPAANKKNLGVILMKVTAQEKLLGPGGAAPGALLRYARSLPVSTVVCGIPKVELIEANVASARAFTPMGPADMDGLRTQLAGKQVALEQFFADHSDHGMA